MKYIDAEKLKTEIERRRKFHDDAVIKFCNNRTIALTHSAGLKEDAELFSLINSLQQEQPEVDLEEAVFKEWGTTKEEYLAKSMDKVHLEMEIATYLQDWDDDDEIGLHLSTDNGSIPIELEDIRDLARHFYELARQKYEK